MIRLVDILWILPGGSRVELLRGIAHLFEPLDPSKEEALP
jgi:hypothetical protein